MADSSADNAFRADAENPSVGSPAVDEVGTSKPKRKPSAAWDTFDKISVQDPTKPAGYFKTVAKCRFCGKELTANSCSGTSHLIRHAAECTRKIVGSKFQSQLSRSSTGQLSNYSFNQVVARRETVKYIIKTEQPFSRVEDPDFEEWIQKAFGPQFQPISRNTVKRDIEKLYAEEKTDLFVTLSNIPGRICLTSDLWTSNQPLCYISLTAHFIDANWILQKRIICFSDLDAPHTGQAMATSIINQLQSWGIYEKIFTITLDNASSNDVLARFLERCLPSCTTSKLLHVRCCCHILNLIVQDGLEVVKPFIERIKQSFIYIFSSTSRYQEFRQACKTAGLRSRKIPTDVRHRWNSTYLMIEAALPYKNVISTYLLQKNYDDEISLEDWACLEMIRDLFKVFYNATVCFSGIYYATSNQVLLHLFHICDVFNQHRNEVAFEPICEAMEAKF